MVFFTIIFFLLFICLFTLDRLFPLNLPENNNLFTRVVVDENNRPLRSFADEKGIWRYPIDQSQVSPLYIEALINYEDRWFWSHPGINPFSLIRAAIQNVTNNKIVSGGSTLSMQVARILHPHERSLWGKTKQMLRTIQLEWHLDKKRILQIYLNTAPFGGTIEGVQAASFTYLNKSAQELTHAEAALLAVLPQAPTRYRPDLHAHAAQKARDKVLKRLSSANVWPQEVVNDALLEQVYSFNYRPEQLAPLLARRLLNHSNGQSVVKSTIDSDLQLALQELLAAYMIKLPRQSSAAILVVENKTSAVKAYIGAADFANPERHGYVDMVQAIRSPGSTLKPFIYGLALDEGLIHSQSLLADVPRTWGSYRPSNFNGAFNGPVSATDALQRSLNMPAVDLLERYGVNRFVAQLENAGLNLVIPGGKPNLAIILGGAGASLEQLVESYSAFANEGKVSKLRFLQAELNQDKSLRNLLSPESAWVVQDILAGIARPESIDTFASHVQKGSMAWKTGTSYGFRDSWAIGVTKEYTLGVWLGRPDGTAMPGHYGSVSAGPLLFNVADRLGLNSQARQAIVKPEKVTEETICWPLGTIKSENQPRDCQVEHQAWIINNTVPPTWHTSDGDVWQSGLFTFWYDTDVNTKTQLRVSMDCVTASKKSKTLAVWPKVLEPWVKVSNRRSAVIPSIDPQCASADFSSSATLKITGIEDGNIYRKSGYNGKVPSVWLKSIGGLGVQNWYINGKHAYQIKPNQSVEHLFTTIGKQQIIVQDQQGSSDMLTVHVE